MSETNQRYCHVCGEQIPTSKKHRTATCLPCVRKGRVALFGTCAYADEAFATLWARGLFNRLYLFLQARDIPTKTQYELLFKATEIFQEAEKGFGRPEQMSEEWLEEMIERRKKYLHPAFFRAFLIEEHYLFKKSREEKYVKALPSRIQELSQGYQRALEVYYQELLAMRQRHLKLNASRPLTFSSIYSQFEGLFRLVRWLTEVAPDLIGWEMVQTEHIHAFLLTLPAKSRGPTQRKLLAFFRQARKRRLLMHIPLAELPSKELPQTDEPLPMKEQKAVARLIREDNASHPFEVFLTALCFYHGLSRQQIQDIKLSDVHAEQGMIQVKGRPPIYLLQEDSHLLEQFLLRRGELPYAKQKSSLVINNQNKLADLPLDMHAITKKVRIFSGHTPRRLRMTCLAAHAALYGPQYLVDAFGISLTHAARFGKMEEFLLEEEIKQQREAFVELSRHL